MLLLQVLRFSRLFKPVHTPHVWRKRRKKKEKEDEKKEEGEETGQEGKEDSEDEEEFMSDAELSKFLKLDTGREPKAQDMATDEEVVCLALIVEITKPTGDLSVVLKAWNLATDEQVVCLVLMVVNP